MNLLAKFSEAYWDYLKAVFNPYFALVGILILVIVLGILLITFAIGRFRSKKKR